MVFERSLNDIFISVLIFIYAFIADQSQSLQCFIQVYCSNSYFSVRLYLSAQSEIRPGPDHGPSGP